MNYEKVLIYRVWLPAGNGYAYAREMGVYGEPPEKNIPEHYFKPKEAKAPEPPQEPKPAIQLEHYCRFCGAFAFVPIDLCDDCLKIKNKRKKKKSATRQASMYAVLH